MHSRTRSTARTSLYALDLTGGPDGQRDGPEGQERINDTAVGRATGSDYERQDLDGAADRRSVLTEVEKSVAQGRPVPADVSGEEGAHALTTIAQEGDMLQVYNPWGSTTWVSDDDFINGHMGKVSNSDLPNAYSVCLPR